MAPHYFVDEMMQGAFKSFRHLHIFIATEDGTIMFDIFDYKSPLGLFGVLADKIFLEKYMEKLLIARNGIIKFEAEQLVIK